MAKYRKKPVVIEAVKWTGTNGGAVFAFCDTATPSSTEGRLIIPTLEGDHTAEAGDYIIKGVKGEFYPCKPDIFEMTYDKVEDDG